MSTLTVAEPSKVPGMAKAFGFSWPLLVAGAGFLLVLNNTLLVDADTYWHLATARWMFEHLSIPMVDPFSHSRLGSPWVAHEWLAEITFGASFQLLGWAGPAVMAAAAFAATLAMLCRYLLRHLEPIYAICFVALAACLIEDHLLARPHALALPFLAAWFIALLEARDEGRIPTWYWAILMPLWANLHGSFVLGLALAGFFAFEATLSATSAHRWVVARSWGSFILLALAGSLLTPNGWGGLKFAADLHEMKFVMDTIGEWKSPDFHHFQPLELGLMVAALAIVLRGLRLPWLRALLVLGLLHLALVHGRHVEILGLIAPLILAEPVATQWGSRPGKGGAAALDRWFGSLVAPARLPAVLLTFTTLAGLTGLVAQTGMLQPFADITPAAAVLAGQAAVPKGKVLNDYHFGGYLIFSGIAPCIDGRSDVYGDRFVADYINALSLKKPDRFTHLLAHYDIEWTLLAPGRPAIALLDQLPGWRRLYADETAVVHVRVRPD